MTREADQQLARVAAGQHSIFTFAHARLAGLTADQVHNRIATKQWIPLYEQSYAVAGVSISWKGHLLAACWAGGFRAAVSHRSAAALHGLPGGRRNIVELTCPRWRRARHDGLHVHETNVVEAVDLIYVDSIPVSTPERTLLDLGAVCHPSVVEMAVDAAENRGLVTVSGLRRTLQRLGRPGRNGAGVLRRILTQQYGRPAVPESEMETMLFQVLRRHGLPEPIPQYEVRDARGGLVARVDAAYPDLRIAIEYDSVKHHSGKHKLLADSARRNRLWAAEWLPLTATYPELRDGGARVCSAISGARRRAS